MPASSRAQQRLMGAAEHGAKFPMAKKIRSSMSHKQMHDFASGSMKNKPEKKMARGGRVPVGRYGQVGPKAPGGFGVMPPPQMSTGRPVPAGYCSGGRV